MKKTTVKKLSIAVLLVLLCASSLVLADVIKKDTPNGYHDMLSHSKGTTNGGVPDDRHSKVVNMMFVDGHAEGLQRIPGNNELNALYPTSGNNDIFVSLTK